MRTFTIMAVNIISLNVRGLRDSQKRRTIFDYYRKKCNILCIQETHSDEDSCQMWTNEWGGRGYYNHGEKNARGVAILIKKGMQAKCDVINKDNCGRYLVCDIVVNDVHMRLINVYAPNKDSPAFFEDVFRVACSHDKIVIIGDFNTVLNSELDRKNTNAYNNDKSARVIKQYLTDNLLEDVWRSQNPTTRRYSWYRKRPRQYSRIDFCISSLGINDMVHNCFYLNGILTDHSAMFVGYNVERHERGPGFWKFNTRLLSDITYVNQMNQMLQSAMVEYHHLNPNERWDLLKNRVKLFTKNYCQTKSAENNLAISQLSEYICNQEDNLDTLTESDMRLLEGSKADLENLLFDRTCGVMFRSKAKWHMEGEKNTKYFYSLEKSRYTAKTSNCLIVDDATVTDPDRIIEVQHEFYQELYKTDPTVVCNLSNCVTETVPDGMAAMSELQFSLEEVSTALAKMKNGSCPGPDGLPAEFYKCFWRFLAPVFHETICYSYDESCLFSSGSRGVLNLIPKQNKDTRLLKNLRPITLLNADYKVIEKAIANRMVPALDFVINSDQRGFLPGRHITTNIRKILDLAVEMEGSEKGGYVVNCDFLKCFDRIETGSVVKSMEFLGFSELLRKWVEVTYKNFSVRVQNNGHFSKDIQVTRSVHQGGCASNAYFLTVAEMLAITLRQDPDIRGISFKEIIHFLNQFADDLDLCLEHDQQSFDRVLHHFHEFRQNTGFQLSYEKTSIYRVGSLRKSKSQLYTVQEMNWTNDPIRVLGIDIYPTKVEAASKNYGKCKVKVHDVINSWKNRSLSIIGKINVINTLIASLYVFPMSVLQLIPLSEIKELHNIIEGYIWNHHRPKIPLDILQLSKKDGGVNLVNFRWKDLSLKTAWVRSVMCNEYPSNFVYGMLHPIKENIWTCNLKPCHIPAMVKSSSQFWKDVLFAWCTYHYFVEIRGDQIKWLNSNICIEKTPVWWEKAYNSGLVYVSQLYPNGHPISAVDAKEMYSLSKMQLNSLLSALPVYIRKFLKENLFPHFADAKYAKFMAAGRPINYVYRALQEHSSGKEKAERMQQRWHDNWNISINVPEEVAQIGKYSLSTKLQSFQLRLIYLAVVTNVNLRRWKLKESDMCSFCDKESETVLHLFFECECVQPILRTVARKYNEITGKEVQLDLSQVMFGRGILGCLVLIYKQYVYRNRCLQKKLCAYEYVREVNHTMNIEKYYAVKEGKLKRYFCKWEPKLAGTLARDGTLLQLTNI